MNWILKSSFSTVVVVTMEAVDCGVALEGCAAAAVGAGAWRGLSGRRDGLRLSDSGRLILRLGLGEEVLVAKESGEDNEHHCHGGAHIATTTAAAGPLRLQIWIVNFGQRKLPIVSRGQPAGPLLYLW